MISTITLPESVQVPDVIIDLYVNCINIFQDISITIDQLTMLGQENEGTQIANIGKI